MLEADMKSGIKNIVILGAGNVGTHLAWAFRDADFNIAQIVDRSEAVVAALATDVGADHTSSFSEVKKGHDLYITALPDHAMEEVLPKLGLADELLVHTSGSMPLEILKPYSENIGVFYPLQTFSRKRKINFKEVPLLLEANRMDNEDRLLEAGKSISGNVRVVDSAQRQAIHIAAVFASNFSNHMYEIARQILDVHKMDFDLLIPLIKETASKAAVLGPGNSQTGPASREDMETIAKHLQALGENPGARELYKRITQNIIDQSGQSDDKL